MPYGVFDTYTMLQTVEISHTPKLLLIDMVFPEVEKSSTEYITFDVEEDDRQLAPFVRYESEGKVAEAQGYKNKVFVTAYSKQKTYIGAKDLYKRPAGQTIYQGAAPADRVAQIAGRRLGWLKRRALRTEEWMACQLVQTGKLAINENDYNVEIDFGMNAENQVEISDAELKWSASTSDPMGDIEDWAETIEKNSGHVANKCILGTKAAKELKTHTKVWNMLDNRRIIMGDLTPRMMPNKVRYLGMLGEIDFYVYSDFYRNSSGVLTRMWPANKVLLFSDAARCKRHYGAVYNIKAGIQEVQYFPSSWETDDPAVRWIMLEGAPLPCMYEPDGFLCATVSDAS